MNNNMDLILHYALGFAGGLLIIAAFKADIKARRDRKKRTKILLKMIEQTKREYHKVNMSEVVGKGKGYTTKKSERVNKDD